MLKLWLPWLTLLIYPLVIMVFDLIIKRRIPEKIKRNKFKQDNEYVIKHVYLFAPLLILNIEFIYLRMGFTIREINFLPLIIMIFLQSIVFLIGVVQFYRFFKLLKKQD